MNKCECTIRGKYIDPEIYISIVNHKLRQKILHGLFTLGRQTPITKKELARKLGIEYNCIVYQLNNHLRQFWEIKRTEKVRGATNEYLAPPDSNTIYVCMGPGAVVWHIDPLANLFGKLKTTGTRCRLCPPEQQMTCVSSRYQMSCCVRKAADSKKQQLLLKNNCREPYSPVDYLLTCTIISELEEEDCSMKLNNCNCYFLQNVVKELTDKQYNKKD